MSELVDALQRRVGERVRSLRTGRGLTQRELADRVCISRPSIANVEAGRQNVGLRQLCALAGALGVGVCDLVAEVRGGAAE
jgi:transcriptional regulator with XRE-family HTH domain